MTVPAGLGRGKCDQTGQTTGRWQAQRPLAEPDERVLSGTQRLRSTLGGGVLFQRLETDDGLDANLPKTKPTVGRSRFQSAGLHPPALAEPMQSRMISTEQYGV